MKFIEIFNLLFLDKEKLYIFFLLIGFFCVSIIEIIGIASILPFISIVLDPDLINTNHYLSNFYNFSGFENEIDFMIFLGICLIIILFFINILYAVVHWQSSLFVNIMKQKIANRLLLNYSSQSYKFIVSNNVSTLINNITVQTDRVITGMLLPITLATAKLISALIIIIFLFIVNPGIAAIAILSFLICYMLIYFFIRNFLSRVGNTVNKNSKEIFKYASEIFYGIKDIKINGGFILFHKNFYKASLNYANSNAYSAILSVIPRYLVESLAFTGVITLIIYFLLKGGDYKSFIPLLGLYAIAGYRILPSLQMTYVGITQTRYNYPSLIPILDGLKLKIDDDDKYPNKFNFSKNIEIENISFAYDKRLVLENISVKFNKGEKIGIVGSTGSGKTTLLDLLLGLYEPNIGRIKIDGLQLDKKNTNGWKKHLNLVPQNLFLLDESIKENILFGLDKEKVDDNRLNKAIEDSMLTHVISNLKHGIDTIVGDRGLKLSGGERQRIGIARALYRDSPCLILDESTNALDRETEDKILSKIFQLKKTIIIVTHRLEITKDLDKIVLLENGKLVAFGTYDYLIKNEKRFKKQISNNVQ